MENLLVRFKKLLYHLLKNIHFVKKVESYRLLSAIKDVPDKDTMSILIDFWGFTSEMVKKYLVLPIAILTFLFLLARYLPVPRNADMPMWFLTTRLNDVVRKYGNITSTCSFIQGNDMEWCVEVTNENRKNLSNLNGNQGVLYIDFNGLPYKYDEPIEIYAMFECFLYLSKRITPKDIVAIVCISQSGEWFDANSTTITITTDEFRTLYSSINVKDKTNALVAKELSNNWIKKQFYNRYGLVFDEEQKFKESLVTPWNEGQTSYDNNFSMRYGYGTNKLSISKITKNEYDDVVVSTSSTLLDFEIDETGFVYGAWDDQNNIWLYGEDKGIRMYEFDGEGNWEPVCFVDEAKIPYPLKEVRRAILLEVRN